MLEGPGVGLDRGDVQPALVGEGVAADVRLVGMRRHVADLVDQVGRLGQPLQAVGGDAVVAELELQRGQDRDQVAVAGALAVAVDGSLHHGGAGADGGDGVGDRALGVVVGVDRDAGPVDPRDHRDGRLGDLVGQAGAVGVAERHVLSPRVDRGPQALERVAGVVSPGVEEVLGVVDDPLAVLSAEGDRLRDHRQVLIARDLGHLLEVQAPGLANQRHRRSEAADERGEPGVLGGGDPAPAGRPEGGDRRLLQLLGGEHLEELELLRVRAREAGLDHVDAQAVERVDHAHLLGRRQRHALSLHAVAEGRVVELDFVQGGTPITGGWLGPPLGPGVVRARFDHGRGPRAG